MSKPKKRKKISKKAADKKLLKVIGITPKTVEEVPAAPQQTSEAIPEGLVECELKGTHLRLLGMKDRTAIPTLEQRVAMARRLNEVGPKLPRYVKNVEPRVPAPTIQIGATDMPIDTHGNPISKVPCPMHSSCACTDKQRLEAGEKLKRQHEARKKGKLNVVPKATSKPNGEAPAPKGKKAAKKQASQDPGVKIRGISAPPVKKKAGMAPTPVPKGGFTKENKPATSGELIRARIGEHKLTDDAIAAEVRKLWPGRTTAVSDVRWNRSQMEKAGVKNIPEPVEGSTVPGKRK